MRYDSCSTAATYKIAITAHNDTIDISDYTIQIPSRLTHASEPLPANHHKHHTDASRSIGLHHGQSVATHRHE